MKGYKAVCVWPFIFMRPETDISERKDIINHEHIHARQQIEMLWFFFFLWYAIEYLLKRIRYRDHYKAYRSISFEKEAFLNDSAPGYLQKRKAYYWMKYI